MSATPSNPEIGQSITAAGIRTNYLDSGGAGAPVLLIHGSGPGVSAWANWRLVMPALAQQARVIAPDMVGFGYTERPEGFVYNMDAWVRQAVGLLDALGIERTDLVGNSFGGGLSLALAIAHPERVRRLVLMGSATFLIGMLPDYHSLGYWAPALLVLLLGASFVLNVTSLANNPVAAFYSPQTRFWELIVGALLAYLWLNAKPSSLLMGDAGSRAMGFFIAMLSLKCGHPFAFLLAAIVFIVDGSLGILKISFKRFLHISILKNTLTPLHDHVRKRLGWSDEQVVARWLILQAVASALLLLMTR